MATFREILCAVVRAKVGTCAFALTLVSIAVSLPAFANCAKPEPKPNGEFFQADAVFTGKVLSERYHEFDEDHSGWLYRVRVERIFKGSFKGVAVVYMENASNRFPLYFGSEYLLFAYRWHGRYEIDRCGNSALLSKSAESIQRIEKIATTADGEIEGWLVSESEGVNLSGIDVTIRGRSQVYRATTDKNGWFQIRVPKGGYRIDCRSHEYYVPNDDVWYDPKHFRVHAGETVSLWMMTARR